MKFYHNIQNIYSTLKSKKEIRDFFKDDTSIYASSLSFYTIFSVIPILLLTLSISTSMKGFLDIYNELKNFIFSNMMPVNQEFAVKYLDEFLNNSFNLGIIGFISILYTSIMFFYNFDSIVVKIFNTERRDFWHSLTIYWTLVTLTPIALALSFFISYEIQNIIEYYASWINVTVVIPYFIIWGLFFIIYRVVPNQDIYNRPTLIASFVASLVWYILKSLFIYYAFYSKSYTSVYGPFAIALFFFIWINISWLILLYGLKLLKIINGYDFTIRALR